VSNTLEDQSTGNISDGSNSDGNTIISKQSVNDDGGINGDNPSIRDEIHDEDMNELPKVELPNEEEEIITEELYEEDMEDPYKEPITIDDKNVVTGMNMSQLTTQQGKNQNMTNHVLTHSYILRECPTKQKE